MTSFKSLGLSEQILKAVVKLGFETPTEVQKKVIPKLLKKNTDLVALAQTGTGKTVAFGFPMLQLIEHSNKITQGLILSPTRELCLQITNDMSLYSYGIKNTNIVAIYGGANITEQANKVKRGAQILIATPGRLKDMIRRKLVDISNIKYCVLDEADEMLNMGFYEDIKSILSHSPKEKCSWLFSATMPPEVNNIAKNFMNKPIEIIVGTKNSGAKNVDHQYYIVSARERYAALRALVNMNPDIFGCVFCRTKIETQKVADRMINEGHKAAAIHGDLSQSQRDAVMQSFRNKKIQLLIATDVAARGIDVDDITHVINYQLPDEIETYIHRSGRTGRAGKKGTSVIFVLKSDRRKIKQIENKLQKKLTELEIPSPEKIFHSKISHWIQEFKNTALKSELKNHIPKVLQAFESFSKEKILKLILSREFNSFTINQEELNFKKQNHSDRRSGVRSLDRKINAKKDKDRFFINIGSRDKYQRESLKDFLKSFLKLSHDDVFQVDVMKNFSFFSIHQHHRNLILKSFDNLIIDNRKVNVELAEKDKVYSLKNNFKKKRFKSKK
jgi:ATP-dependent RNA helicase DeaD